MYMYKEVFSMKLILIAEPGDYLINVYTKEIKRAKWVFPENGNAFVDELSQPESDSPKFLTWDRHEYLVIPNIADIDPALWDK